MLGAHLTAREYFEACRQLLRKLDLILLEQLADEIHAACERRRRVFLCRAGQSAACGPPVPVEPTEGALDPGDSMRGTETRLKLLDLAGDLTDSTSLFRGPTDDERSDGGFVGQLEHLASEGDLLIAVSPTGNDAGLLKAVGWANRHGLQTWGLTSHFGGELRRLAGRVFRVPLTDAGIVESMHLMMLNWALDDVRARIAGAGRYENVPRLRVFDG